MLEYTARIEGRTVVLQIESMRNHFGDEWTSEDGWLVVRAVRGGCDGWIGYGGCQMLVDFRYLPLVLETPEYEHDSDLAHVLSNITRTMEELNGYVLP